MNGITKARQAADAVVGMTEDGALRLLRIARVPYRFIVLEGQPTPTSALDEIARNTVNLYTNAGTVYRASVGELPEAEERQRPQRLSERDKLLKIIGYAYQVAGAHGVPDHILDVLSDPEGATDDMIEAMLPYAPQDAATA